MLADQLKGVLAEVAPALRARGVTALFLFGSTARGEESSDSDIDLFFDYAAGKRFSLFDQMDIEDLLAARLGRKVDLMTRNGLHPMIRDRVLSSAIRVL